ncbi:MFS transporter [Streptosporangium violaceochromogenes]|nr:MFS transporter [Streptosporangium violaceochromogenes]
MTADQTEERSHRPVLQVVLRSPRPVLILVAGVFLNRSGSYFGTFLALFLKQIGFTLQELPLVLLGVGVVIPLGSVIGGWLADRFSRKASLVGTTLMAAVGLGVIGAAPGRDVALLGVCVAALFAQAYLPAASAVLIDHTEPQDRVPTFAFFRLALNLGAAIGPVIAIAVVPYGLERLFLISAVCYLLFGLIMLFWLPAERRAGTTDRAAGAVRQGRNVPPDRHSSRHLPVFLAAVFGITLVYVQYSSTVSLAVSRLHDVESYAALITINAVLVILVELPLSGWTRRLPWWRPLVLGTVLMAVGIPLSGAAGPYWLIVIGVLTWTVGEILFSPVIATAVADLSADDRIGRYQSYLSTTQACAFAFGPAIGIFVYGIGPALLWGGCLVVGALCVLGFVGSGRAVRRQAAPRDEAWR